MGIQHKIPCPYTPQQNGKVEHKNRQIVEIELSLLNYANVSQQYWSFTFHEATVIINLLPTKSTDLQIPF